MNTNGFGTIAIVSKSDGLNDGQRERVATLLEGWVAQRPSSRRTNRAVYEDTGIDISSLSKIRNPERRAQKRIEGIGLNTVLKLREMLKMPIDAILDLKPLPGAASGGEARWGKNAAVEGTSTYSVHHVIPPGFEQAAIIARMREVPLDTIEAVFRRTVGTKEITGWRQTHWLDEIMTEHMKRLAAEDELRATAEERRRQKKGVPKSRGSRRKIA